MQIMIHNIKTPANGISEVWFQKYNLNFYSYKLQYFIFQWIFDF